MATNAAWTPLFFGQKRPRAALLDIGGNVTSAASYAAAAGQIDRTAGLLMIPYVAWVGFASSINASVVRHNGSGLLARLG
jgi:tryptophan-rich sensory protein